MDVLTVYDEFVDAVKKVREEQVPLFYEINTYRYKGHSMSDPAKYRTKEELEEYKGKDPIILLQSALMEEKIMSEDEFTKMDDEIRETCKEAADFAEESDQPALETLYEDVYAE